MTHAAPPSRSAVGQVEIAERVAHEGTGERAGRAEPTAARGDARPPGAFVVSLDFELHWGVRDKHSVREFRENLSGARVAVPRMLDAFREFEIHATWAVVGFLFFSCREDLLHALPARLPAYDDPALSPYPSLAEIGEDESSDPFHYGRSLVERIRETPHQEIGTHTFSHYYCLEPGQDRLAFQADLEAAVTAARSIGVELRSIVFPRNQVRADYLGACADAGIVAFRGTEESWLYRPRRDRGETSVRRAFRLLDAYVNLSGHHAFAAPKPNAHAPVNVPASRFLRPHNARLRHLDGARQARITAAMTHAAHHGLAYHLWWHPHNFGRHLDANMRMLRGILGHYRLLAAEFGMRSRTMHEQAEVSWHA